MFVNPTDTIMVTEMNNSNSRLSEPMVLIQTFIHHLDSNIFNISNTYFLCIDLH